MGAHRTSGAWQAALLHPDMPHHCGIQNPCVKGMICLVCSRSWHNTTFSFFFFLQKIAPSIYWRSLLCARRGLTTANTPKCLQKLQPCWWPRGAVVQTKRRTREKGWQSNIAFNTSLFFVNIFSSSSIGKWKEVFAFVSANICRGRIAKGTQRAVPAEPGSGARLPSSLLGLQPIPPAGKKWVYNPEPWTAPVQQVIRTKNSSQVESGRAE